MLTIFLIALNYFGAVITGTMSILGIVTETHDDVMIKDKHGHIQKKKILNRWGRWTLKLAILGILANLGSQIFQQILEADSTKLAIERGNNLLRQVNRSSTRFETIQIGCMYELSSNNAEVSSYNNAISARFEDLDVTNEQLIDGLDDGRCRAAIWSEEQGDELIVKEIEITSASEIGPTALNHKELARFLAGVGLKVRIYHADGKLDLDKAVPDFTMIAETSSAPLRIGHDSPLRVFKWSATDKLKWSTSGRVYSFADLAGATVVILPAFAEPLNNQREADAPIFRLLDEVVIQHPMLNIDGIQLDLDRFPMEKQPSKARGLQWVYRMPTREDEFFK